MEPPFDAQKLDRLLEDSGIDLLLATTKHNVQYLMGDYRYFFFQNMDAIGLSRYLPVVGYPAGLPDKAFYVGAGNEDWGHYVHPPWTPTVSNTSWSSEDSARVAAGLIRDMGLSEATIGVERSFLPADALSVLCNELPGATLVEAIRPLEDLRAVKSDYELSLMRVAADGIVDSMLATIAAAHAGDTEQDLVERFRWEQTRRGLVFDYCLITTGPSWERAPSDRRWQAGETLSLDSGGRLRGYIGDLTRMGVMGEPTPEMQRLLDEVRSVVDAAREPIRDGVPGEAIYKAGMAAKQACSSASLMTFVAHGEGLVTHEAPRLTATGPVPYPADHAETPLQSGMVLSIETHALDPKLGFVKLEDVLTVTDEGWEAFGDRGRGWNVAGV